MTGHQGRAGSGAAGEGRARTPFPDPHHEMRGREHLHKMHVGFGGEGRVHLQLAAEAVEVDLIDGIHRHHYMGVPHASGGHGKALAVNLELTDREPRLPDLQRCGDRARLQEGSPHIHADRSVGKQFRDDAPSQGVHLPGAARSIAIAIRQEARQTADPIAAHLGLGAIGIEDAHAQLAAGIRRQGQDHAIATDTKTTVAELNDQLRCQTKQKVGLA